MTSRFGMYTGNQKPKKYICDICAEKAEKTYECKECLSLYCKDCGNPKRKLCILCISNNNGNEY